MEVDLKVRQMILVLTLVLIGIIFSLSAMALAAEKIVINQLGYASRGETWKAYFEARKAEFEEMHSNVTIERSDLGTRGAGGMEAKYMMLVGAGTPPDVTEFNLNYGAPVAAKGMFMDLRPFFERDPDISTTDFPPNSIKAATWTDGTLWGFPTDLYSIATAYNVDMFTERGLQTPNDLGAKGWTWDAAVEAAKKLTLDTNGDGVVDQWGIDQAEWTLVQYAIPIVQAGGSLFNRYIDPTESRLTNPKTVQGYQWLADLFKTGATAPLDVRIERGGKVAMYFAAGPTMIPTYNHVPDLNWNVGPPTMGPDNNAALATTNLIQMTAYTEHPDIVWEWMKYLVGNEENLRDLMKRTGRIPAYAKLLPAYKYYVQDPPSGIANWGDVVLNPKSFIHPMGPGTTEVRKLIYKTFVDQVIEGGQAVRPTLEALEEQVNAVLAENHAR